MATSPLCSHIKPGAAPFETLFVLEEYLGIASALVACRDCHAAYLLELIDLAAQDRAYRVTSVEPSHAHAMVRTLSRGTCDVQRARGEVQNLESRSTLVPAILAMQANEVTALRSVDGVDAIPKAHWRDLPCDGRWLV